MNALYALIAVFLVLAIAYAGVAGAGLEAIFGIAVPYGAVVVFVCGLAFRLLKWGRSAVPFRITTTCGQQKSLPFLASSNVENPHNLAGVISRMAMEILFFRSLFRNTKAKLKTDGTLIYSRDKWLWLGALALHWGFLIVLIRHLRFFAEPVPFFVWGLQALDGFFKIGVPIAYLSGIVLLTGAIYLLVRRIVIPQIAYISLATDYFPLFLIMAIAGSGLLMRHVYKVDLIAVKTLTMGLVAFQPRLPEGIGAVFFVHLFCVSVLFAYFPFSKLMHLGGVFLSPTRNLVNNSRMRRHINPWNYAVKTHSYADYEDEFRDVMRAAGLPLEKVQ